MIEKWLPVKDYEGIYEVSNLGRIRRVETQHMQRARKGSTGYLGAQFKYKGRHKQKLIHQVVMDAFVGPRPEGMVVNHKDRDKTNNTLSNLEYLTYSDNNRHSVRRGDEHPFAKFTNAEIEGARQLIDAGVHQSFVYKTLGCSQSYFSQIMRNLARQA